MRTLWRRWSNHPLGLLIQCVLSVGLPTLAAYVLWRVIPWGIVAGAVGQGLCAMGLALVYPGAFLALGFMHHPVLGLALWAGSFIVAVCWLRKLNQRSRSVSGWKVWRRTGWALMIGWMAFTTQLGVYAIGYGQDDWTHGGNRVGEPRGDLASDLRLTHNLLVLAIGHHPNDPTAIVEEINATLEKGYTVYEDAAFLGMVGVLRYPALMQRQENAATPWGVEVLLNERSCRQLAAGQPIYGFVPAVINGTKVQGSASIRQLCGEHGWYNRVRLTPAEPLTAQSKIWREEDPVETLPEE